MTKTLSYHDKKMRQRQRRKETFLGMLRLLAFWAVDSLIFAMVITRDYPLWLVFFLGFLVAAIQWFCWEVESCKQKIREQ